MAKKINILREETFKNYYKLLENYGYSGTTDVYNLLAFNFVVKCLQCDWIKHQKEEDVNLLKQFALKLISCSCLFPVEKIDWDNTIGNVSYITLKEE